jgi:hypothetical protein
VVDSVSHLAEQYEQATAPGIPFVSEVDAALAAQEFGPEQPARFGQVGDTDMRDRESVGPASLRLVAERVARLIH